MNTQFAVVSVDSLGVAVVEVVGVESVGSANEEARYLREVFARRGATSLRVEVVEQASMPNMTAYCT